MKLNEIREERIRGEATEMREERERYEIEKRCDVRHAEMRKREASWKNCKGHRR